MPLEIMSSCNECNDYIQNHAKIYCEKCFRAYGIKLIEEFEADSINLQTIKDEIDKFPRKTVLQLYIKRKR